MHIVTKIATSEGLELEMDCPSCKAMGTSAVAADLTAREYLYGVIPVTTSHYTTITCRSCDRSFRVSPACDQLAAMTPDQVSELVATQGMKFVSTITKFCIVMSLVMGIVPFFGLGCAIAGVIGTRNCRSRWRTAAFIGLAIAVVVNAAEVILISNAKSR